MLAESNSWVRSDPTCIPSSVVPRITLGEGDERPDPVGEKICRLDAPGSRDMLNLAVRWQNEDAVPVVVHSW